MEVNNIINFDHLLRNLNKLAHNIANFSRTFLFEPI